MPYGTAITAAATDGSLIQSGQREVVALPGGHGEDAGARLRQARVAVGGHGRPAVGVSEA